MQIAFRKSSQPASPVLSMHHHSPVLSMHHHACSSCDLRIAFQTDPPTLTVPTLSGRQLFPRPPSAPAPVVQSLGLSLSRTARSGSLGLCLFIFFLQPRCARRMEREAKHTPPLAPLLTCPSPPSPRSIPPRPSHSHPISPLHSLSLLRSRRAHTHPASTVACLRA